ncbi:MAG TPA: Lsr2 family protein [Propionibacteriaceae bacterium]|nr:Lsr2 family protein [Propionibacteriaceae bacterium]
MAQRTVVAYYSDLSGVAISDDDASVRFSLDGANFEIDLSPEEQAALREALAPFLSAARTVGKVEAHRRRAAQETEAFNEPPAPLLRGWARENGFDVPARGRVPALVREAYRAAHSHRDVRSLGRVPEPVSTDG